MVTLVALVTLFIDVYLLFPRLNPSVYGHRNHRNHRNFVPSCRDAFFQIKTWVQHRVRHFLQFLTD
jgi:hypothetical protein